MAFDKDKFLKVWRLAAEGSTKGERAAASRAAKAMAKKAGMTMSQAKAAANQPDPPPRTANMFEAFFSSPEWKAESEKRERERQAECVDLLKIYGSREAVFAETTLEEALRDACEPLATWRTWFNEDTQEHEPYIYDVAGWSFDDSEKDMPASVREAVSIAAPLPSTVLEAWEEFRELDDRRHARWTFDHNYRHPIWSTAREYVVEATLWTLPAVNTTDILARLAWADRLAERGVLQYREKEIVALIRADVLARLQGSAELSGELETIGTATRVEVANHHDDGTHWSEWRVGGMFDRSISHQEAPVVLRAGAEEIINRLLLANRYLIDVCGSLREDLDAARERVEFEGVPS